MPMVIVDTSEWAQYFRVAGSPEAVEVRRLLTSGNVVMVGIVYAELFQGARDGDQLCTLQEQLDAIPFLEASQQTWRRAGSLMAELHWRVQPIPLPAAVIAAQALEHQCHVFTRDEHFRRVPEVKLYDPLGQRSERQSG